MPDALFADPRLARLYDIFEGDRTDLAVYLRLARELGARSVLDVGCGTGCFAILAAAMGLGVSGVDPAQASLDVARGKPGAEQVHWHCGELADAPLARHDLAVLTGNVAQVFLDDAEWQATLRSIRERLHPGGHLVYETRRPEDRAWERWQQQPFEASHTVEQVGLVRLRRVVTGVELPFVSFRHVFGFPDGSEFSADSTLRFRGDGESRMFLEQNGFRVLEVREAPDHRGRELVYLAVAE